MKEPTTPCSIDAQNRMKINREFLISKGFVLTGEYPLFEEFKHSKDYLIFASIGLYGSFSIGDLHWCNKTVERVFSTMNPNLTEEDFDRIVSMLCLKIG